MLRCCFGCPSPRGAPWREARQGRKAEHRSAEPGPERSGGWGVRSCRVSVSGVPLEAVTVSVGASEVSSRSGAASAVLPSFCSFALSVIRALLIEEGITDASDISSSSVPPFSLSPALSGEWALLMREGITDAEASVCRSPHRTTVAGPNPDRCLPMSPRAFNRSRAPRTCLGVQPSRSPRRSSSSPVSGPSANCSRSQSSISAVRALRGFSCSASSSLAVSTAEPSHWMRETPERRATKAHCRAGRGCAWEPCEDCPSVDHVARPHRRAATALGSRGGACPACGGTCPAR